MFRHRIHRLPSSMCCSSILLELTVAWSISARRNSESKNSVTERSLVRCHSNQNASLIFEKVRWHRQPISCTIAQCCCLIVMWFQMQFIKTTFIPKPHITFSYKLRHFKMSFTWHYKVMYSSAVLIPWGTRQLIKITSWSKIRNIANLYAVGTAWYFQGNRTSVCLSSGGRDPERFFLFKCFDVSAEYWYCLCLMFVAEAAGYSSPTQFLMVALRNLLTYLSVKMSHEYLVRCYHKIISFYQKRLYCECTVNSRPAWLNATLHVVECPLRGRQNTTQFTEDERSLHHHVLFSIVF